MRIAVVSDIHGNRTAFHAVLADLRHTSPDLVIQGGDLAYGGSHPAEIIDEIRVLGWPGVQGNTDEVLWAPQAFPEAISTSLPRLKRMIEEMIPITAAWIGADRIQWLKSLPRVHSHAGLAVVHASPDSLWRSPLADATDSELEGTYSQLRARVVVYGHIHHPYVQAMQGFTVANSGSVSLSYDGDTRASYLIVEDTNVSLRRVEYDIEREVRELAESGLPHADWIARTLRAGRYVPPE